MKEDVSKCGMMSDFGVVYTDTFSRMYPVINNYLFNQKEYENSRDGRVKEMLDVKTILTNPYRRCVGGYNRNINIFFLLAEAMWIVLGRKDVKTLVLFNKNMEKFSDDGETFHAPYGFRLRHWGIRTEDKFEEGMSTGQGMDQVINAIKLLSENPNSRQVVMSIWNPNFDLGFKTKDIPCNDMIMLKIRHGQLITTIQNRSNDLHWGLPTNIFQFSFLTEIIAACLGISLGTQTHNSQSLHIYEWNDIASTMNSEFKGSLVGNLYDAPCYAEERRMDFNFSHTVPVNRFREVEYYLTLILDNVMRVANGEGDNKEEIQSLAAFSKYLYNSYLLLKIYLEYKHNISESKTIMEKDIARHAAIAEIEVMEAEMEDDGGTGAMGYNWDISVLAKNFFAARLSKKIEHEYLGKL